MNQSFELEEVLEALDLPAAEPGIGFLQTLFARFNERVPFETASKIVRNAQIEDPGEKPRLPEVFWTDHIAHGAGGTCFARVAAFDALLSRLGFGCRIVLGCVQTDFDHAALLVRIGSEEWISDVGFPLPAVLACREGETETGLGPVRVTRTARGWRAEMLEGVPEGPRSLEIFEAPGSRDNLSRHWRETFRPAARFLSAVSLRLEKAGRAVSFAAGEIRVDDLHSRTRLPLAQPRAPILEEQFGVDRELLERAFALAGDPEPAIAQAEVGAYLEFDGSPAVAFDAIASPEGYGRLMAGAARVTQQESSSGGWRVRLAPPQLQEETGALEEEITPDPVRLALRVRRANQESSYEVASRSGRTFLVRRLMLPGPRPDLLRNDSLRGRFAGSLAVDLLAWARLLGRP